MSYINKALALAKVGLTAAYPVLGAVDAAKDILSDAVAARVREQAHARAYEKAQAMIARAHRDVAFGIFWQNGLLLLSLVPVYLLRNPLPFYAMYALVAGISLWSAVAYWPMVVRLARTRSLTQTVAVEVHTAIEQELLNRDMVERKVVEWLGPDLKELSVEVARKLRPEFISAARNLALTLVLAFIAFRIFAIPWLEQKALQG